MGGRWVIPLVKLPIRSVAEGSEGAACGLEAELPYIHAGPSPCFRHIILVRHADDMNCLDSRMLYETIMQSLALRLWSGDLLASHT